MSKYGVQPKTNPSVVDPFNIEMVDIVALAKQPVSLAFLQLVLNLSRNADEMINAFDGIAGLSKGEKNEDYERVGKFLRTGERMGRKD